ncbi:MAG: IS91 family transposase, partial [Hyphomicrobiaceae bacterium]|nr:IS91 family transposase [Hyphomicrobiaceae bacterium]
MLALRPPSARQILEVANIFRGEAASFLQDYSKQLSSQQKRVFSDIQACRTAVMGGHVRACNDCDHREIAYNSCRNRHCPKCQAMARAQWLAEREAELLPIPYFHIIFTLPAEVAAVALQNKRLLYGMLFKAASATLKEVAANPRHLGAAQIGVLAVLHTWGQNLMHHPHLHCVVSGGGLSQDDSRWIASKDYYFLPVKVLSRVFRNKFGRLLEEAFGRGELGFYGKLAPLAEPTAFRHFLDAATNREWVVYAKRPFREPACVLKYLARYTHRVAISNRRLVSYRDGHVTFRYKDYARQSAQRVMTLTASEFIRRFLMHVLPDRFMRIRHYGFLANRDRRSKLKTCRRLLGCDAPPQ